MKNQTNKIYSIFFLFYKLYFKNFFFRNLLIINIYLLEIS